MHPLNQGCAAVFSVLENPEFIWHPAYKVKARIPALNTGKDLSKAFALQ